MDDALAPAKKTSDPSFSEVLILVVMDDALAQNKDFSSSKLVTES